jgi:hypothetical protein
MFWKPRVKTRHPRPCADSTDAGIPRCMTARGCTSARPGIFTTCARSAFSARRVSSRGARARIHPQRHREAVMPGPGMGGRRLVNPAAVRPVERTDPAAPSRRWKGQTRLRHCDGPGRAKLSPQPLKPAGREGVQVASEAPQPARGGFCNGPLGRLSKMVGQASGGRRSPSTDGAQCRGAVVRARTRRAVHRLVLWAGALSTAGAIATARAGACEAQAAPGCGHQRQQGDQKGSRPPSE